MNSDLPFIITVKASNIYDDNDRYNLINNIKDKELINYIIEHKKRIKKNLLILEILEYGNFIVLMKKKTESTLHMYIKE